MRTVISFQIGILGLRAAMTTRALAPVDCVVFVSAACSGAPLTASGSIEIPGNSRGAPVQN